MLIHMNEGCKVITVVLIDRKKEKGGEKGGKEREMRGRVYGREEREGKLDTADN